MNDDSKYRAIFNQVASEIVSGKYGKTGRLPSEAQLVKRFGVSRPTVGKAVRELELRGLVHRRKGSGTYVRPEGGTANPEPSLPQLGMIVPTVCPTEIFDSICGELASLCRVNDFVFWSENRPSPLGESRISLEQAEAICDRFIERGVAGVFFVPFEHLENPEATNRRITDRLKRAGIPLVLIDRDLGPFPARSEYDLIGVDNFAGGYLLAERLIKMGARQLGYVMRPLTASTVDARIAGARIALQARGLRTPEPFVHAGDPLDLKFVRSLVQRHKLDAVLCTSDHLAAQLLQSLNRLGIRVPQDLRLVGFDNVHFASLLTTPLTTMEQPCRDIAITAFNALRDRLNDSTLPAREIMLTPRMMVRESCGTFP